MDENPELQAKLRELDHELEEGDITRKGYEKRRTVLLSQYLGPQQAEQVQGHLRIHSVDEESYPQSDGSRNASFVALTGGPQGRPASPNPYEPKYVAYQPTGQSAPPLSQVGRFHERELGIPRLVPQRQSSFGNLRPQTPDAFNDNSSRGGTMVGSDYRFNPAEQPGYTDDPGGFESPQGGASRLSTMMDSQQGYFADFAGQQMQEPMRDSYGGPNRYSADPNMSPYANFPPPAQDISGPGVIECQLPLEPRDIPFDAFDPHDGNVLMTKFDNIGAVLRHRGQANSRQSAYWVLDQKGKEIASITWEKLASRAEKVAQVIKEKTNLYRGDRVALVYRDSEIIDFAVALMGCFLAGVVAVPMNNAEDYQKLILLLTTTQTHLALTTDNNLKAFQRDISAHRQKWPAGVEWWKTNEFGSYHPKKKNDGPQLPPPDLAYIEFSHAPTGDLRGVVLSHRTIMHQMACLQAIISTIPTGHRNDLYNPNTRRPDGSFVAPVPRSGAETILTYLDPREGIGLILGVLFGVYGGHTTIYIEPRTVETPGLYAHLITKYKTTVMVADYPGLKRTAYNYQQDPMATRNFKKSMEPNFASVKICLIDALTVECEFNEILADRWLRPMRNPRARELVAPMLCLLEHGGMVISIRDWLGGEERMGCPLSKIDEDDEGEKKRSPENQPNNGYSSLIGGGSVAKSDKRKSRTNLSQVLLDKEALKTNEVLVVAMGEDVEKRANDPGVLRVGAFGYPIPDATLSIVDPETKLLCQPYAVGEIWVDSPSLSGGFWALPNHTETIFHARPYRFIEGSPTPVRVEPEFLRTGLLGCVIEGKIYVLGLYEDRIRQRIEWTDQTLMAELEHRHFFVQHLVVSIMKNVPTIYDCSAFDCHVNGEYLPIILLETQAASTAPTTTGGPPRQLDIPFLDSLSERVMQVLYSEHRLRVYCVMVTTPNTLPRIMKNGRREIGNMRCRKEFDNGTLACVHVKFGVERSVQNVPCGDDPIGGIWSPLSAQTRAGMLMLEDKQYSGVDYREVVMDDQTSTPLNQFSNICDLTQWRVSRQADGLAFCTIDGRGKEGKGVTWKKFDLKVCAVAMYLKNKVKIQPGDRLLLMYTHSEEFVFAVHACLIVGAVAIPMAPLDQNRLSEDAPALLHMIADFKIKAILVNHDVDNVLKQKPVTQHLKQSATVLRINIPNTYNTTKPPKQNHGCRDNNLQVRSQWLQSGTAAIVWVYWTPDQRRIAVQLGHDTIMAICKVQKETCQMTSTRPILGCVRSTMGIGFIHTCFMGIYLASPTYLVSPVEFSSNPSILFQTMSRYKIKDTYATSQMLDHAIAHGAGKGGVGCMLNELKNLMITTDGRPRVDVYQKVRLHFAAAGLDRMSINTIYSHVLNPMIASRSYMCIEPIELWLDANALRRGLVVPIHPDTDPTALLVQDSGTVPVSTQICIVNPETNFLCRNGEYGEIWVQSEANVTSFYGTTAPIDADRFNGRTADADPNARYMRTGDLGFLHTVSRPVGPNGEPIEMQILFVLGAIGETFEVMGLLHFPIDIEASVERCHRNIVPGGCAIFQAGGLVVVLVEVHRRNFLASVVPVIVNAVLNAHHIIIDIVAFVSKGDFPRSRLGEKQRGKILSSWVTRKMRTIAQFSIRDPELESKLNTIGTERPPEGQGSLSRRSGSLSKPDGSMKWDSTLSGSQKKTNSTGSMGGSTAVTTASTNQPVQHLSITEDKFQWQSDLSVEDLPSDSFEDQRSETEQGDFTPTDARQTQPTFPPPYSNPPIPSLLQPGNATLAAEAVQHTSTGISPPIETRDPFHYSPIDGRGPFSDNENKTAAPRNEENAPVAESNQTSTSAILAGPATAAAVHSSRAEPPAPNYASKPYLYSTSANAGDGSATVAQQQQQQRGETDDVLGYYHGASASGDRSNLPSQTRQLPERPVSAIHSALSSSSVAGFGSSSPGYGYGASGGAGQGPLRVANKSSVMGEKSRASQAGGHEKGGMKC